MVHGVRRFFANTSIITEVVKIKRKMVSVRVRDAIRAHLGHQTSFTASSVFPCEICLPA